MARPTAEDVYAKALDSLKDAEVAARDVHQRATSRAHIDVAEGYRLLAESLDASERAWRTRRVGINQKGQGA
jgi:hypothetical protein